MLTVGPDTKVLLDEFVYDPDPDKQRVVVNAGVGVLRFVTGQLRKAKYTIRTPTATIGVRGTIFVLVIGANGLTEIFVYDGAVEVRNLDLGPNSKSVVVRQGESATVAEGQPPSDPGPFAILAQTKVAEMDAILQIWGSALLFDDYQLGRLLELLPVARTQRQLRRNHSG